MTTCVGIYGSGHSERFQEEITKSLTIFCLSQQLVLMQPACNNVLCCKQEGWPLPCLLVQRGPAVTRRLRYMDGLRRSPSFIKHAAAARHWIDLAKEAGWHADHFISLPQPQITVVVASQGPAVTADITVTHLRHQRSPALRQRSQNALAMLLLRCYIVYGGVVTVWLKYVWREWQQQPASQNKKCTQFLSSVIDCPWSFQASWDEIKWLLHKTTSNIDDISLPWPLNELPYSLRLFDECFLLPFLLLLEQLERTRPGPLRVS